MATEYEDSKKKKKEMKDKIQSFKLSGMRLPPA